MPGAPSALHSARKAAGDMLDQQGLTLVACSGGADSLALAAAAAWHHQRTSGPSATARVGGIVVDHHLHPDSVEISGRAVSQLKDLGLDPVRIYPATVRSDSPLGPEAAARTGRYQAFREAMQDLGATRIMLAHTKDDQVEQVLLGLARGSGTRSLAGIPAARGPFRRPLLDLSRADTESICRHHGLDWWDDPANADPRYLRSKIRTQVLPYLERELSGSIRESLARTAKIAAADADYLESQAKDVFPALLEDPDHTGALRLKLKALRAEPPAIRRRVIALAVAAAGGPNPSFERLSATEKLVTGSRSAGPVELEGHIRVHRGARQSPDYGKLVIVPPSG
ncbi:tRNA lysidine(34) synthetase TilS [Nesterenkonia salmonea]|uniref:tRNA(Ile)-lysidine synthase n=1 Tax=Nesterenkonia salmonea TaxID=1804987 RepID=A0A5R9BD26_9MICC|nr:tRNA lysidine(34) synthetase TilS [Nesterenkonia salmonea]TLP98488.1 tRNA lysidine(34) synthetase TilS [Nesterenkonia salmonea]